MVHRHLGAGLLLAAALLATGCGWHRCCRPAATVSAPPCAPPACCPSPAPPPISTPPPPVGVSSFSAPAPRYGHVP